MTLGFRQRLTRISAILGRGLRTQQTHRRFVLWLLVVVASILGAQSWRLSATPTLTVTKSAALLVDQNNNGLADPGDQLRYTITITNAIIVINIVK